MISKLMVLKHILRDQLQPLRAVADNTDEKLAASRTKYDVIEKYNLCSDLLI